MSRYLQKYVGTYRVKAEYDQSTNDFIRDEYGNIDQSFDDLYIPCKGNGRIVYLGKGMLQYYCTSKRKVKNIIKAISEFPDLYHQISGITYTDEEGVFVFNSQVLEDLALFISPKTSGAGISPFSSKNLPKKSYRIPKNDSEKYKAIISSKYSETPLIVAQLTKKFVKNIMINGERGEVIRKKMCLGNKEFIHKIGKWNEYLDFLNRGKDN